MTHPETKRPTPNGLSPRDIPRVISWNTTFKCNLRCAHCYMSSDSQVELDELSTEEGKMLIDQLNELSKPVLILSGGEPLMREDIFELAKYGTEKGLKMAMGTNGTLIDDETAKKLAESGVRSVAISMDSARPEVHDEFRGVKGAWERAIEGTKACQRNGIAVRFNTTVTQQNFNEIEDILELADSLGLLDVQLFFLVPTGRGKEVEDITPEMYEDMIKDVLVKYADHPMTVKPTCAPQFMRIADQLGQDTSRWTRGCIAGMSYGRVYPQGDVTPCPYLPIKLGNIMEQSFADIWTNSPVLKQLRDFDNLKGRCGICEYREKCGGCRARAYGMTTEFMDACGSIHEPHELQGDFLEEEPWCTYQPKGVE
ncbi:radical SAM protein [archaeon]|nr:radical SAM protein [archaeon]